MDSCRVLIVDDNARARAGLRALLSVQHELTIVGEAADGQEAVRMVGRARPDVVLLDERMPRMDGLEATRRIKERWPEVRVIVLSMVVTRRTLALAAGADGFLSKGCPAEELLEAILGRCQAGAGRSR